MELTIAVFLDGPHDCFVAPIAAEHGTRARLVAVQLTLASLGPVGAETQVLLAERRRLLHVDQIGLVEFFHGVLPSLQHVATAIETHLGGTGVLRAEFGANQTELGQRSPTDTQSARTTDAVAFASQLNIPFDRLEENHRMNAI